MATKNNTDATDKDTALTALTSNEKLTLIESILWARITDPEVNAQTIVWASKELRNVIADREAIAPSSTPKLTQLQALKRAT